MPPAIEGDTLKEVVVTAFNATRRLLSIPGSLTLISQAQIESENPVTVIPLLQQASGVFTHSGTLSTSRITIRGIGAREPYSTGKIRAYFNNIPLTNGSGTSIVEHIDPSIIERLEIIKGPATSVYGAGLGGTINIVSRQPSLRPSGITSTTQVGSYGLLRNSLLLDGSREDISGSLVYSRTSMDGYRQNSEYRRDALTGIGQYIMDQKTKATALLYYSGMKGYIPSSVDSLTFMNDPRAAAASWGNAKGFEDSRKWLAGISGTHAFTTDWQLDLSLFSTLNNEMERRPWDFLYEDRISAGTRIQASWSPAKGLMYWKISGGAELFFEDFRYRTYENQGLDQGQGQIISSHRESIRFFNFFAQADLDYGRLNLSAGLNANTNRVNYQDLRQAEGADRSAIYRYGIILSPRLSANFRYNKYHAAFVTLSHGFSPPSIAETLTPDGFVNLDILPEKSWNLESGFRGSILDHQLFYDLSFYRMMVSDLLVAERVGPDAWVGRNAGSSVHQGIEVEFNGKLFRSETLKGKWLDLREISWRMAYSFNEFRFRDFVDEGVDYSGKQIPGVPRHFLNSGLSFHFMGGLYARAAFSLSGRMPMNDLNTRYSEAYHLLDLTLGYQQDVGNWKLDLYASVNNLTNQHYASMILVNAPSFGNNLPRFYYPGLPVHYAWGLRLGFQRH
ncbi:MAG: TonB-dependent receptor [Bacteroides sp.]|nr:TonB-dependent receptor [Bacteroides sp.]